MSQDCLFCKFVRRDVEPDVVHETPTTLAFRDIDPQAPTHVLVIPKEHHANATELAAAAPEILVDLVNAVAAVAAQEGLDAGYRMVFNTGRDASQTVLHAHCHVLAGRPMSWPPG